MRKSWLLSPVFAAPRLAEEPSDAKDRVALYMDRACRGGVIASVKMFPHAGELTGLPVETRRIRFHNGPCVVPADPVANAQAKQEGHKAWEVA